MAQGRSNDRRERAMVDGSEQWQRGENHGKKKKSMTKIK